MEAEARFDRIESTLEAMVSLQQGFSKQLCALADSQSKMVDMMGKLVEMQNGLVDVQRTMSGSQVAMTDAITRLAEAMTSTVAKLDALTQLFNDLVRKRPIQ